MNNDQQSLGKRIAAQRQAVYMTQAQLAAKLDVRQSAVSRWETDDTIPALRHRLALAEALLIHPHLLYVEHDETEAVA